MLSCVRLFETPWTIAHQAPLSMEFSRKEYWSGLPFSSVQSLSHVRLFATPWTRAHQAPLSMEFSRQKYWTGLLCPPPEDLPNPGIKPASLMFPAWQWDTLPLAPSGNPLEKGMATHSSILSWRIPWKEEPGGLQSMGSQRVRHD